MDNLTPAEPPGIPAVWISRGEQSYQRRSEAQIPAGVGLRKHRLPQLAIGRRLLPRVYLFSPPQVSGSPSDHHHSFLSPLIVRAFLMDHWAGRPGKAWPQARLLRGESCTWGWIFLPHPTAALPGVRAGAGHVPRSLGAPVLASSPPAGSSFSAGAAAWAPCLRLQGQDIRFPRRPSARSCGHVEPAGQGREDGEGLGEGKAPGSIGGCIPTALASWKMLGVLCSAYMCTLSSLDLNICCMNTLCLGPTHSFQALVLFFASFPPGLKD